MQRLFLLVCCAAVAASAVELKSPAEVALEWNKTVEQAREAAQASDNLIGHSTAFVPKPSDSPLPVISFPPPPGTDSMPGPRYDAPSHRRTKKIPHDRPPGAMPWEYNGQTYWLVPLAPHGER